MLQKSLVRKILVLCAIFGRPKLFVKINVSHSQLEVFDTINFHNFT